MNTIKFIYKDIGAGRERETASDISEELEKRWIQSNGWYIQIEHMKAPLYRKNTSEQP